MKISYQIKEISKNIFAVVVPEDYDRGMLFCKAQEFYESIDKNFINKKFSIWDYYRWYSLKSGNGCFSYARDYVGFNFPLIVGKKCYEVNEIETPYDEEMNKIIEKLFVNGEKQYIIGVDSLNNSTFYHELCHALYYTNFDYRVEMDKLTNSLSKENLKKFKINLAKKGYNKKVLKDEIQAYMSTEIDSKIAKGIREKKKIHQKYKSIFKKYKSLKTS